MLSGFFAVAGAEGEGWMVLVVPAGLSAFLVGAGLWRLLVVTRQRIRWWHGTLTGALTGLLAHPVCWYLMILYLYLSDTKSSLGEDTLGPLDGVGGAFAFSFWSLLLFGWLTAPVGAIIGLIRALRNRPSP